VVENRTGAGGTIGMDAAMKSAPDGYTVLITNDNAASAPHIMNLSYDYTKELLPICYLGRQSQFHRATKKSASGRLPGPAKRVSVAIGGKYSMTHN